jgi:IclR family acetate operon transcriptional repressor
MTGNTGATSVGRALRVIEAVADAGDGVTAKALARRLGYSLPTTYRLLSTLVEQGYLVRLAQLRGYGLGYRLGALSRRLAEQVAPPWSVRSVLHELHEATGCAAYYALFRGGQLTIAHLESCAEHPGRPGLSVGEVISTSASAAGRVLLASVPRRQRAALLGCGSDAQPVMGSALSRELELVGESGLAVAPDEQGTGWASIAAPVCAAGTVRGALNVSLRRTELFARRSQLERAVRDAADQAGVALTEHTAAG